MELILLRHPPPDVPAGVCYGQSDIGLDPSRFEATIADMSARLEQAFVRTGPAASTARRMVSSPLKRCALAAERLAAHHGLPLAYDERLAEMHFGAWEMQPWLSIAREDIDAWAAAPAHYASPGGESARDVARRVHAWRTRVDGDVLVVVTHLGPIRLLAAQCLGLPMLACQQWPLAFGGVCQLRCHAQHAELICWGG
ncbi:MAG: histidine phosphatase family protein [Burkholderiales bacterium]|nr:histidine phosphatase family protein [Burkholderiales bacterium]